MHDQPPDADVDILDFNGEPNVVMLIEQEKAFLEESFPDVEVAFLASKLSDGWSINRICEYVLTHNHMVPKKTVVKPPTPHRRIITTQNLRNNPNIGKMSIDYFKIDENRPTFFDEAASILEQDFKKIGIRSLRSILLAYKGQYAPTFRAIVEALNCNKTNRKKIKAKIPTGLIDLAILIRQRVVRTIDWTLLPRALRKEVEWTKKTLKESLNDSQQNLMMNADDFQVDETLEDGNSLECPICYVEYETSKILTCLDGHLICRDCLSNHVKETVYGQNKADIVCAEVSCDVEYTREAIECVTDDATLKKYDERIMEENLAMAEIANLVRCRFCNFGVIVDVPIEVNKVFKCGNPRCGKEICRRCNIDWQQHIGIPCDEIETDADEKFRKQAEERLANAVIRYCHKCKAPIIKETGCNKMTCRCGARMCYLCRQPDIDYDHFCRHPMTPPRKTCRYCNACKLHEDAGIVDKENLNALTRRVHEEQKALLGKNHPVVNS